MAGRRSTPSPLLCLTLLLAGCRPAAAPSILDPQGPAAARIAELWWVMLAIALAVLLAVLVPYGYAVWRFRGDRQPALAAPTGSHRLVAIGGVIVPALLLVVVLGLTIRTIAVNASPPSPPPLTIQVTGYQFWWEVRYPELGIVTANEIHLPAGQAVRLELAAADVIHAFWVPQLDGKHDMTPGYTRSVWLQADEPGVYRGICAEFCGVQHALMGFLVIAQPAAEFDAWVAQQQQPAAVPTTPLAATGRTIFLNQTCVNCHAIRGTTAAGQAGPDLTHVGSRHTLAAATIENSEAALARFIAYPQEVKPGNLMPALQLRDDEVAAIAAYLASLR